MEELGLVIKRDNQIRGNNGMHLSVDAGGEEWNGKGRLQLRAVGVDAPQGCDKFRSDEFESHDDLHVFDGLLGGPRAQPFDQLECTGKLAIRVWEQVGRLWRARQRFIMELFAARLTAREIGSAPIRMSVGDKDTNTVHTCMDLSANQIAATQNVEDVANQHMRM